MDKLDLKQSGLFFLKYLEYSENSHHQPSLYKTSLCCTQISDS